jgi:two-component system, OmpR family, response regulator
MTHYNILIVDDEKQYAKMLAKRLNLRGCVCEVCYDGRQALDVLIRKQFFLTLLDLHLPDMYGTEVLTRIKACCATMPVIILTGHGTEKDRAECIRQGAYAFMHKPLGIDALMTILERIKGESA